MLHDYHFRCLRMFLGFLLIACWMIFASISIKRRYNIKSILMMSYSGGKKSLVVVNTLLLIGAVTDAWMASGTIPGIVYYCLRLIHPDTFILLHFLSVVYRPFCWVPQRGQQVL